MPNHVSQVFLSINGSRRFVSMIHICCQHLPARRCTTGISFEQGNLQAGTEKWTQRHRLYPHVSVGYEFGQPARIKHHPSLLVISLLLLANESFTKCNPAVATIQLLICVLLVGHHDSCSRVDYKSSLTSSASSGLLMCHLSGFVIEYINYQ